MPLLNYTTTIEASKTVLQIQDILRKHGAKTMVIDYDNDGNVEALSFVVKTSNGEVPIRLPVDYQAIIKVLMSDSKVPMRYADKSHAVKIAWRILKDWIEAQMAILETEMVKIEQIFLPYVVLNSGKTVYEQIADSKFQLKSGGENNG